MLSFLRASIQSTMHRTVVATFVAFVTKSCGRMVCIFTIHDYIVIMYRHVCLVLQIVNKSQPFTNNQSTKVNLLQTISQQKSTLRIVKKGSIYSERYIV
jgi:hypothetical protein